jgi:hypothetical protein
MSLTANWPVTVLWKTRKCVRSFSLENKEMRRCLEPEKPSYSADPDGHRNLRHSHKSGEVAQLVILHCCQILKIFSIAVCVDTADCIHSSSNFVFVNAAAKIGTYVTQ